MATQLIPATSSAPSLTERAKLAFEIACTKRSAETLDEQRREIARTEDVLRLKMESVLGLVDVNVVTHAVDGDFDTRASYDDLWFQLRGEELTVQVPCGRHCGKELWTAIHDLQSLGYALEREAYHSFHCLQQFDEDGEPITDRLGNPLPVVTERPRRPHEFVADVIAKIDAAGERLAQALRAVQELEDGRSSEKSAAVRRIMQTLNEETQKPHSASSAEKVVEMDAEYLAYRRRQADAEVEKQRSYAAYEAAKRTADLEIEHYRVWERNR